MLTMDWPQRMHTCLLLKSSMYLRWWNYANKFAICARRKCKVVCFF